MIKNKKHGIYLAIICLLPIAFYMIQFNSLKVSNNTNDWAIFGNYLSGVFSLISVIVLAYLTYIVSKHEDLSKLNEFRYKAYIELTTKLDTIKEETLNIEELISLENYLRSFCFNNLFLFEGNLNEIFQHRIAYISHEVSSLRIGLQVDSQVESDAQVQETNISLLAKSILKEMTKKDQQELFDKFSYEKFSLIGFIQCVMVGKSIEPYKTEHDKNKKIKTK